MVLGSRVVQFTGLSERKRNEGGATCDWAETGAWALGVETRAWKRIRREISYVEKEDIRGVREGASLTVSPVVCIVSSNTLVDSINRTRRPPF